MKITRNISLFQHISLFLLIEIHNFLFIFNKRTKILSIFIVIKIIRNLYFIVIKSML